MSASEPYRPDPLDRRSFLQAGAASAAALAVAGSGSAPAAAAAASPRVADELPKRTLGKTGEELTILNAGTWRSPGLDRLLRLAYSSGIRVVDTAKSYGSEPGIGRWLQQMPEVRKNIFLVTKDGVNDPKDLLRTVDERLADLKTDYIDLYFVHGLGSNKVDWPKSKEFKEAAEALRKSGKVKYVGFSTHDATRAQQIMNAAEGGFVDAIMLQFTPWLDKDDPLNKALDACYEKGIGLISMKQVAGTFGAYKEDEDPLAEAQKRVPMLQEKGFSPYQGLLQAIWSDERITTTCVSMRNTDQIRENVAAALDFGKTGPLKLSQIHQLRDACRGHGMTLCADCDGRCSRAAGTEAPLGDLTRYLTYLEHHGYKSEARRLYAELSDAQRSWREADLDAARRACPNGLNFSKLLPRVDDLLA
ncbi:aldo/keto reductase [Tautonia sp. JC769]|uniref:aldo/keto reductase n=1 Tax=Tautonia sp. JC769 TaxID=3232135 RepID=UPI003459266B